MTEILHIAAGVLLAIAGFWLVIFLVLSVAGMRPDHAGTRILNAIAPARAVDGERATEEA